MKNPVSFLVFTKKFCFSGKISMKGKDSLPIQKGFELSRNHGPQIRVILPKQRVQTQSLKSLMDLEIHIFLVVYSSIISSEKQSSKISVKLLVIILRSKFNTISKEKSMPFPFICTFLLFFFNSQLTIRVIFHKNTSHNSASCFSYEKCIIVRWCPSYEFLKNHFS